jgi:hypothetical protein
MNLIAENDVGDRFSFTSRGLGKTLKALGFHSKQRREGGVVGRFLGVDEVKLRSLMQRYFVPLNCTIVPFVPTTIEHKQNGTNNGFVSINAKNGISVTDTHINGTNGTNGTSLVELLPEIITQLQSIFGKVCFASIENYCKIDTSISTGKLEEAIQTAKTKGLIFEPKPDQFEVLK